MSEFEFLEGVKRRMDAWAAEFENAQVNAMLSGTTSGKMLRSKLVFAIVFGCDEKESKTDLGTERSVDFKTESATDSNTNSTTKSSKDSKNTAESNTKSPTNPPAILDSATTLCAVVELIQLASLLHDDVIDDATLRRGKKSINAAFGAKNAIMLGDLLYSCAYFHLCGLPQGIAKVISRAVCDLSIGEIADVALSERLNTDQNAYLKMCEDKTAALIRASAESAAILAGFSKAQISNYKTYGNALGVAFQLVDDLLDVTQDEATLGKPNLSDFKEGKTTLPYIYLWEKLVGDERKRLESMFKKELDSKEKEWIKQKMHSTGALKQAAQLAQKYGKIALKSVSNARLKSVAQAMIERDF